jgi:hypothetical protein
MALLDIPHLSTEAFKHCGDRKIKLYVGDPPSPSPAPATTSQTQTAELPEWARPYAKETLAKGSALTDINANPYQTYGADRIAGFTPMQQQAQQQAQQMQPSAQLGMGTSLAAQAGMGALNAQYQPSQFGMLNAQAPNLQSYQMGPAERVRTQSFASPNAASTYMSPYMQNVVDVQQREAQRQADIAGTQRAARATQAGAFGGSRQAIENAEAARNLATQKGDIQATGLQSAYQSAQGQFNAEQQARLQAQQANQQAGLQVGGQNLQAALGVQQLGAGQNLQSQLANQQAFQQAQQLGEQSRQFGAGLGMQGLQTGLQAAGQLGQLGQTQYGQQMGINQLQAQYGAQQQAQQQQANDIAYQNFLNQQNYPYKQLGYMSDMIRGMPLGQQSTSAIYQAPPSAIQSAGSLGLGAYGLSQLFKADGGLTKSYAGGGVTSQGNVENILSKLSDAQLAQAKQMALAQRDAAKAEMIDTEMRERAIARNGISGTASNSMMDSILPTEESMARGGIVAFSGDDEETGQLVQGAQMVSGGAPDIYKAALQRTLAAEQGIGEFQPKQLTQDDLNNAIRKRYELDKSLLGENVAYNNAKKYVEESKAERAGSLDQAKGLAALKAAAALSQGNNLIRGLGAAGSEFASTYGQALQADRAEKRALANMEFNLADAQRKESMGMLRSATTAAAEAQKNQKDANAAHLKKLRYQGELAGKAATAAKPYRAAGAGAGAGEKPLKVPEQLSAAEIAFEKDPTEANLRTVTALRRTVAQTKTSDIGTNKSALEDARLMSAQDAAVLKAVQDAEKQARIDPEYLKSKDKPAYLKGVADKAREAARANFRSSVASGGNSKTPPPPSGFIPQ